MLVSLWSFRFDSDEIEFPACLQMTPECYSEECFSCKRFYRYSYNYVQYYGYLTRGSYYILVGGSENAAGNYRLSVGCQLRDPTKQPTPMPFAWSTRSPTSFPTNIPIPNSWTFSPTAIPTALPVVKMPDEALPLHCGETTTGSTNGQFASAVGEAGVLYVIRMPSEGDYTFSLCGSSYDTLLRVYDVSSSTGITTNEVGIRGY